MPTITKFSTPVFRPMAEQNEYDVAALHLQSVRFRNVWCIEAKYLGRKLAFNYLPVTCGF